MVKIAAKTCCVTCGKEKATSRCVGCLQDFCFSHLAEHRQELKKQLDEIAAHSDLFQQTLQQQLANSQRHLLLQQVDQWEHDSIQKIKQTAEEVRQLLSMHRNENIDPAREKLYRLRSQLKHRREQNDIVENDLQRWKEELHEMTELLNKPSNITILHSKIPLVNKIQVEFSALVSAPIVNTNAVWIPSGVTVAGENGHGNGIHQLYYPCAVYVKDDQTIYVADQSNHRIVEWKNGTTIGQIVVGAKGMGGRNDQLNSPVNVLSDKKNDALIICDRGNQRVMRWARQNGTSGEVVISNIDCWGLSIDNGGYLYVSDGTKHEVRRWKLGETSGTLVAGGNGAGHRLDQLNQPYNIFVDQNQSVYVSDWGNHRVVKWARDAREGILVAGGQGQGNTLSQLSNPQGIIADQLGTVYVVDQNNHRVMRWPKRARKGTVVVGGNGRGAQANQFFSPLGLSFDRQNNLYIVDQSNHRVQKFNIQLTFMDHLKKMILEKWSFLFDFFLSEKK